MIEELKAGMVRHRSKTHENVAMQIRAELREGRGSEPEVAETEVDLPRDVQEALALDYMARYYRNWLDEPVAALDGRTPGDAAGDTALHPKLIDLIKGFEGMYHHALKAGDCGYAPLST